MLKGILQFDLWKKADKVTHPHWSGLKKMMRHGVCNSLLTACMPTSWTTQILGNNESFEPITSNLYIRRTNAGEFQSINKYLVNDLINLNM
jgi:ribonucleotide reductase alpha subunit